MTPKPELDATPPPAMNRIDRLFARRRAEGRSALMPFITAGDPSLAATTALIEAMAARGADLIEVGVPYSDPIADGPVIAASYHRALTKGFRLADCLDAVRAVRADAASPAAETPLIAMISYAIIHRRGAEAFLDAAAAAGFDGLIVPDLPLEESAALCRAATARGLALIQLITPTTPRDRALAIIGSTTGFIYYVSVAGVTGERTELPPSVVENVAWLRSRTDLPICIGFGIGSVDRVRQLAGKADGLIVGSAIVRRLANDRGRPDAEVVAEVGAFVAELAGGLA